MNREYLGFINIYKFISSIIIGCFLHYRVLFLALFQETYAGSSRFVYFLMAESSNYIVELFFLMSGLVFAFAYEERILRRKLCFALFFDKRLEKLIPLTLVTTIIMFFLRLILERDIGGGFYPGKASIDELISSVILVNSTLCEVRINPAGWYIAKLIVCYAIAFFLTKYYETIGKITFFLPVILGMIIREREWHYPLLEFHMSRAYIAFFLGIILAHNIEKIRKNKYLSYLIIGVSLFVLFICRGYINDWSLIVTFTIFPAIIIIGYCFPALNKIGNMSQVKFLSEVSFDIYLWNCPILAAIAILRCKVWFSINTGRFIGILIVVHIIIGAISCITMKYIRKMFAK